MCLMINAASFSSHLIQVFVTAKRRNKCAVNNKGQWMGRLKWFARLSCNLSGIENFGEEFWEKDVLFLLFRNLSRMGDYF